MKINMELVGINLLLFLTTSAVRGSDITVNVFGNVLDGMPAAFGDFNSDELTDVFVIRNDKTVQVLQASDQEPLLSPRKDLTCTFSDQVTSVVPGDFDGDVFMDVLVTTFNSTTRLNDVHILWGGDGHFNCTNEIILSMKGLPLAMDYNQDMTIDLLGINEFDKRTFWVFNNNRTFTNVPMKETDALGSPLKKMRKFHSNAYLDVNDDNYADLVITTDENFEVWYGQPEEGFKYHHSIDLPRNHQNRTISGPIGQSLYCDVELTGKMNLVLPVCLNADCTESRIMMYSDKWHDLNINFKNDAKNWDFVNPKNGQRYTNVITLHSGDFNMDGYPDLLATLHSDTGNIRTFLLENVECSNCEGVSRTFQIQWNALNPFKNETVVGVFYDFYQDGILDVILVQHDKAKDEYKTAAFKNSLDYDANFVKVMVLTGLTNSMYPISPGSLGKKKRTYGTNLPGPSIAYITTTQDGLRRSGIAAQLPQSAHFALHLPYTIFGLGRTPNFIDTLTVGVSIFETNYIYIFFYSNN